MSSIAIDRLSPSTLYAGTSGYPGGMFKSTDGGATWTRLFLEGDPPVYGIAVDPFDASRVFAATDRGVYRTRDGGASWESRNAGLGLEDDGLGGSAVTLVETDPSSARSLFAATSKGVFRSLDGETRGVPSAAGCRPVSVPLLWRSPVRPGTSACTAGESSGAWMGAQAGFPPASD